MKHSTRFLGESDLAILFDHQRDPDAGYRAAFISRDPSDWQAFLKHWNESLPIQL